MTNTPQQYEIGMVGLGVMERNLLLNMSDHKFSAAGYDKDAAKVEVLRQEGKDRASLAAKGIQFLGVDVSGGEEGARHGCIIRAALLEDICGAFHAKRDLPNLLLDSSLSHKLMERQEDLRQVASQTAQAGAPAPALMVSLGYLDAYQSAWQSANLIQAQRDYFGSHTYERVDVKGTFHTEWEKK